MNFVSVLVFSSAGTSRLLSAEIRKKLGGRGERDSVRERHTDTRTDGHSERQTHDRVEIATIQYNVVQYHAIEYNTVQYTSID